jgi:demethylmenaquinone methyltransferase/2-methoxy-6-polyprenyl-1,4-benzoquinol methylase
VPDPDPDSDADPSSTPDSDPDADSERRVESGDERAGRPGEHDRTPGPDRERAPDRNPATDDDRRRGRGRRLYDRWAAHPRLYGLLERDTRRHRERGVERLGLTAGGTVVDVGCGPGSNFDLLVDAVGPGGEVVGYDYSEGMVERARRRAAANGWGNVTVERVDAAEPLPDRQFDAATATLVLSATDDPAAVVRNVRDRLRPGGRLFVLDGAPLDGWPGRALNPVLEGVFGRLSNWTVDSARAVRPALRATFDEVVASERIPPGLGFAVVVERRGEE